MNAQSCRAGTSMATPRRLIFWSSNQKASSSPSRSGQRLEASASVTVSVTLYS